MAVRHIVWMKFKVTVDAGRVAAHIATTKALLGQIPSLESIDCAETFTDRAGGFTHCIIATLPDRDSLPGYLAHPAHRSLAASLVEDTDEILVMDIEV
jgi:Stress responsive A/B Barrel Domain